MHLLPLGYSEAEQNTVTMICLSIWAEVVGKAGWPLIMCSLNFCGRLAGWPLIMCYLNFCGRLAGVE